MTSLSERMPPLRDEEMDDVQRNAAADLIAGPRKGVKGPFIPLIRNPELMARLQKVGEYLRLESAVPSHLNEFVTLIVSRHWSCRACETSGRPEVLRRPVGFEEFRAKALSQGDRFSRRSKPAIRKF